MKEVAIITFPAARTNARGSWRYGAKQLHLSTKAKDLVEGDGPIRGSRG
jgi:hypothetical protein